MYVNYTSEQIIPTVSQIRTYTMCRILDCWYLPGCLAQRKVPCSTGCGNYRIDDSKAWYCSKHPGGVDKYVRPKLTDKDGGGGTRLIGHGSKEKESWTVRKPAK